MVESHEGKSCRLFNQAIYIYLISCWVKSSFRVELLSQASQLNLSSWVQLLNSTQHFFKKISTWRNQSSFLSLINEALDCLANIKFFIKLNIKNAFNKLCIWEEDEWKMTFHMRFDLYKYLVMLFDLINALTFFQIYMNQTLFKFLNIICFIYSAKLARSMFNMYDKFLKNCRF